MLLPRVRPSLHQRPIKTACILFDGGSGRTVRASGRTPAHEHDASIGGTRSRRLLTTSHSLCRLRYRALHSSSHPTICRNR